jgi:hypothetical protein
MTSVAEQVYWCHDCRLGPRSNMVGWTQEDLDAMWYITPGAHVRATVVGGVTYPLSLDVVPCPVHLPMLEQTYVT